MENLKLYKSSKNLRVDGSISITLCSSNRNNLSKRQNFDEKNSLFNFISSKNKITLESCFDQKGAKKFLSEKEKAMAFLELPDDIIEEKSKKKAQSFQSSDKYKNLKRKGNLEKVLKVKQNIAQSHKKP